MFTPVSHKCWWQYTSTGQHCSGCEPPLLLVPRLHCCCVQSEKVELDWTAAPCLCHLLCPGLTTKCSLLSQGRGVNISLINQNESTSSLSCPKGYTLVPWGPKGRWNYPSPSQGDYTYWAGGPDSDWQLTHLITCSYWVHFLSLKEGMQHVKTNKQKQRTSVLEHGQLFLPAAHSVIRNQ